MKKCARCHGSYDESYFARDPTHSGGLSVYCRPCAAEKQKLWRQNHIERAHEILKESRARHPGFNTARVKAWRLLHPEARREEHRRYYANHKEQALARWRTRRAREQGAEGTHSTKEWEAIRDYWGRCLSCGTTTVPLTEDHVVPLCRGGDDSIANIQPLCRTCNSAKGTKAWDYRIAYWWGV